MKKGDLIKIAEKEYSSGHELINTLFREMNMALLRGESINIANFGVFFVKRYNNKTSYDFKKKVCISLNMWRIRFRPSKKIVKLLNQAMALKEKSNETNPFQ